MMRVLFSSFASPGFLYPLIRLALALRARGHAVAFAAPPSAREGLAAAGLARIPRGPVDGESFDVRRWHHPLSCAVDYKHVEHACAQLRPDVLVTHHLSLGTLVAGERHGLPVAVLGGMTYLYPPVRTGGPRRAPGEEERLAWRLDEGVRVYNAVRQLHGLPPRDATPAAHPLLGDLHMLRTAPPLDPWLADLPTRVHAVGVFGWEPATPDDPDGARCWDELRASMVRPDAPLLYVNSGRAFGGPTFWPTLVEVLDALPVQVLASVGRMDQALGALPAHVLARPHLPQDVALPRARLVVAGGHAAVAIGAAVHGVPAVLLPYGVDTPDNADRLRLAGTAVTLDVEELTAERLRDAIEWALASEVLRATATALAGALRCWQSAEPAATLVEQLARAPVAPVGRVGHASPVHEPRLPSALPS